MKDLYTRVLQDLLISLDRLGLFTGALYKISSQDLYERSLYKSSRQDLFTRPLWEISLQELSTRSLHKTSMRDLYTRALYKISSQDPHMRHLYTRSPDIPGPPRSLHRSSTRSLHKTSIWDISIQELSTTAPRYSESDPTRTNSAEGCTSRNKKCPRLSASDIPSAKWARRYSQSDPTRTKSREGCICKHKIGSAPQRDSKNHSSDRTLTSELQYEMRFFDVLWRKYCACHEKMSPRHTKSCNCHAKWCQHSRSKFDDSFTKRVFRALQDRLQKHQILRLPRKMTIFHHLQFRATLTTILHTSQNPHVLHISRFPKIGTARRRERTSEMDLAKTPSRAGEMHFFDLDHNFSPRGSTNLPHTDAHTTDLHQMLFYYRKNPIVWPHCLGKKEEYRTPHMVSLFMSFSWKKSELHWIRKASLFSQRPLLLQDPTSQTAASPPSDVSTMWWVASSAAAHLVAWRWFHRPHAYARPPQLAEEVCQCRRHGCRAHVEESLWCADVGTCRNCDKAYFGVPLGFLWGSFGVRVLSMRNTFSPSSPSVAALLPFLGPLQQGPPAGLILGEEVAVHRLGTAELFPKMVGSQRPLICQRNRPTPKIWMQVGFSGVNQPT